MPRPKLLRKICCCPCATIFKPNDKKSKGKVLLSLEELEALRLKNIENLEQINCAKKMDTSQSTFQRILTSSYKKISDALINGKEIEIGK
ncbi:DUF134 domain-containing protein [Candidatus Falkowbacteria bacterium]|jgi:uncharacterized protein|nr:DUF134 domain-containing protein [Candidatus Falkowbacteria bacterium]MBT7007507.1 DUF134 domain-containing protein [Candidatus Falkowbacteria bacterium]